VGDDVPLPLVIWGAAAGAAYLIAKNRPGRIPGELGEQVHSGARYVEAWTQGDSLGFILVYPFAQDDRGRLFYLRKDAALSAERVIAAAARVGVTLKTNSAFRFMEEQQHEYAEYLARSKAPPQVARPGYSKHQNGVAWDVSVGGTTSSREYRALAELAPMNGWANTGASFGEPWHWEYDAARDRNRGVA
jgi:hypothetical protein